MFSSPNNQKLYFADGTNWVFYDPFTNTVEPWVATAGTQPTDSDGNLPRLITTWRGRIVLSGLLLDPQNIFMSAVSDPGDWDYSPESTTPTQAVALNASPLGLIGDVVTTLIPYTDDVLVIGCDHEIWMLRGDPMDGGRLDKVSGAIGMAWGQPWCTDPMGNIYFFSNRTGIYVLVPGQAPQRISQQIDNTLANIDTGTNSIRMIYDDRFQGVHVFVTPLEEPAEATHFFYEQRAGAWWTDNFANNDHNPLCCVTFDGNEASDRTPLIGCYDGYVRAVDPAATKDDGKAIDSEVLLGPFLTSLLDEMLLHDCQAVLAAASEDVEYEILAGDTAEEALAADPIDSGTWSAGRNLTNLVRRAGHAIYIRITSTKPWAIESVRGRLSAHGKVRQRGA